MTRQRNRELIGYIFLCELKDFKYDNKFKLPTKNRNNAGDICGCFPLGSTKQHELLKVKITITKVRPK